MENKKKLEQIANSPSTETVKERIKFQSDDKSLGNMPLFHRGHMNEHIKYSGKNMGNIKNHSIPTSMRKAKRFLDDEYLEDILCMHDQRFFYLKAKCCQSYRKKPKPT